MVQNSHLSAVAQRIRQARLLKGVSRRELSDLLNVDVTAVIAWETGKYLPRDSNRTALARHLGLDLLDLFSETRDEEPFDGFCGKFTSYTEMRRQPLKDLVRNCRKQIKILRVSYPFVSHIAAEFDYSEMISRRILNDDLEVRCVEIFYNPLRLQQAMANAFRYQDHAYIAKTFSACSKDVFPGIDLFIFDDIEIVMASFWAIESQDERPILQVRGKPFQTFIMEYWNEIWRHAAPLNPNLAVDTNAFRKIAFELEQTEAQWAQMLEDARNPKQDDNVHTLLW